LALCFLIISLISPRWNYSIETVEKQGSNIFLAIDVSKSMLATDVQPSRLFRAKLEINKLIDQLNGDRLGIIVFAGTSFLQSPLTHDYAMLKDWIQQIDVDSISTEGTSIKSAIETAIRGFSFVEGKEKYLIIISDGEEQDTETERVAEEARKQGIKIISIGIGSQNGAPISYNDELIKDHKGRVVISKLNESLLRKIAKITDGQFTISRSGNLGLEKIYYNFIKKTNHREIFKSHKIQRWKETYQIFLSLALFFLLLEGLSPIKKFLHLIKPKTNKILILLLYLCFNAPAQAFFTPNDKNPRIDYNSGINFYKKKDFKKAESLFKKSISLNSKNNELKERALYNLGNSFFKQKNYKKAINSYRSALKINPQDKDAIYNLKLAEKLLEEKQKQEHNKTKKQEPNSETEKENNKKEEKQKNTNPQNKLSEEELENLLLQVQEGENKKPQNSSKTTKKNTNSNHLNPW